jgi:aldose 1-epimerase
MGIIKKHFATLSSGEDVFLYVLEAGEFRACWCDCGARWASFVMPDARGRRADLLLDFSDFSPHVMNRDYFGETIGRFGNRIAGGRFTLDGAEHTLWRNNGPNHLHGGRVGFGKRLWTCETDTIDANPALRFSLESRDGEEGYPGNLSVAVTVTLSASGELTIRYDARCDRRTPLSLTNHAYFNLAGEGTGTIDDHVIELACSRYLPVDTTLIPIPEAPADVQGTPFDLRSPKRIGHSFGADLSGYDHCFVIDKPSLETPFACVSEPLSGRTLKAYTTSPAVQFYTGNSLNGIIGKNGSIYGKRSGFCLETEQYPDAPNRPDFPSCILEAGATRSDTTKYCFSIQ